jgi:hypothetical protein
VAVNAWWRDESGQAIEQLEWGQALRGTAAGAWFRGVVDEVLGIEFAQPIQSEGRPGAIAQQALTPGTVSGLDAHRAVHGEATAVFPLRHRLRIIARQQPTAHENAQQPPAHLRLHLGNGVGVDPGRDMEDDPARGSGVEHTVDDDAVKVQMRIECRAEAVDEGDGAEACRGA